MRMSSKQEAERLDAHALQREKERERRRIRDRLRRQNMSQEQRDKHLARRRRNYQLRRMRAQNAKLLPDDQQTDANMSKADASNNLIRMSSHHSTSFDELLPASFETQEGEAEKSSKSSRLCVRDVKHLARRLQCDDKKQKNKGILTNCIATKRLRLIHVKRLARAVKISVN